MNIRFQDLNHYQLDDGTVRLEQIGYAGEETVIDAHPEQIKFIARQLCGTKPEKANQVADLERRIGVLVDKLQRFVCNDYFRKDLLEGCEDGFEHLAKLDGLLDLALEFDGGRLTPECSGSDENPSVTVSKPKANPTKTLGLPDAATSRQVTTSHAPSLPAGDQLDWIGGVRP